uniref:Uncharacterized protein n=1 Tax=Aegilops tauschii subsp. strangulata TaxID=200361 RepID=A0A453LAG9_AEGTS
MVPSLNFLPSFLVHRMGSLSVMLLDKQFRSSQSVCLCATLHAYSLLPLDRWIMEGCFLKLIQRNKTNKLVNLLRQW